MIFLLFEFDAFDDGISEGAPVPEISESVFAAATALGAGAGFVVGVVVATAGVAS